MIFTSLLHNLKVCIVFYFILIFYNFRTRLILTEPFMLFGAWLVWFYEGYLIRSKLLKSLIFTLYIYSTGFPQIIFITTN